MNLIKRILFILLMPLLLVLFFLQVLFGIVAWIITDYAFFDKRDPIFITVFNKLFDK